MSVRVGINSRGTGREARRANASMRSALEPEHRERKISSGGPRTVEDFRAAFAEMRANDPEWSAWQRAERLGDLFGRSGR